MGVMVQLNKEHAEEVGKSKNDKLELAGVIGAATLTGGSLIALTGGLAAPAFGHGLGALAPTLGLVPTLAVGILISRIVFEEEDLLRPWENYDDNLERLGNAGKLLAESLPSGLQGDRPVTLVGFSLGARVILKCLQCLAETKGDNDETTNHHIFFIFTSRLGSLFDMFSSTNISLLLGAPVSIKDEKWEDSFFHGNHQVSAPSTAGLQLVAGRFVNRLAEIQPIELQGIENVDATEFMEGHCSYLWKTKQILRQLDVDNYNPVFRIITA
ncbi:hypothetical protein V6N13_103385 [Hibiscus sabdariffa]